MKDYKKALSYSLVFIVISLLLNISFELLEKKVVLTSVIGGTILGFLIYFISKKK